MAEIVCSSAGGRGNLMGLSCTCNEADEYDDAPWLFRPPEDMTTLKASRAKRCRSCGVLIGVGEECAVFDRLRYPRTDIEVEIHGDGSEIKLADWHHCARCGEIFLNLTAAGYCMGPETNMVEALAEYHQLTGFKEAT